MYCNFIGFIRDQRITILLVNQKIVCYGWFTTVSFHSVAILGGSIIPLLLFDVVVVERVSQVSQAGHGRFCSKVGSGTMYGGDVLVRIYFLIFVTISSFLLFKKILVLMKFYWTSNKQFTLPLNDKNPSLIPGSRFVRRKSDRKYFIPQNYECNVFHNFLLLFLVYFLVKIIEILLLKTIYLSIWDFIGDMALSRPVTPYLGFELETIDQEKGASAIPTDHVLVISSLFYLLL